MSVHGAPNLSKNLSTRLGLTLHLCYAVLRLCTCSGPILGMFLSSKRNKTRSVSSCVRRFQQVIRSIHLHQLTPQKIFNVTFTKFSLMIFMADFYSPAQLPKPRGEKNFTVSQFGGRDVKRRVIISLTKRLRVQEPLPVYSSRRSTSYTGHTIIRLCQELSLVQKGEGNEELQHPL